MSGEQYFRDEKELCVELNDDIIGNPTGGGRGISLSLKGMGINHVLVRLVALLLLLHTHANR